MKTIFALLLSVLCGTVAMAKDDGCSNATLNGAYGFLRNGHAVTDSYFTAVGVATFDTIGNMSGHEAVSTNGTFSHADIQNTYAIDDDCTGQVLDSTGTAVQKIVVSKSGDRALGMSIVAGRTDWIEYVRVAANAYADDNSAHCTAKNLAGFFIFQREGHIPAGDLLASGVLQINGDGTAFALQTTGRNGVFTTGPILGAFTVNEDCSGTFFDPATGKVISEFVAVHGRDELFGISETNGNNVTARYISANHN